MGEATGLAMLILPIGALVLGYLYPGARAFLAVPVTAVIYYAGLRLSWWTSGNEVGWGSATVWTMIIVLIAVTVGIVLAALIRNPAVKE